MITGFAVLLVVHGFVHLLGVTKAFNLSNLPQLTRPISPTVGMLWFAAAMLFLASAIPLFAWPRVWWCIAAAAVVLSIIVIIPSWVDARAGVVANLLV